MLDVIWSVKAETSFKLIIDQIEIAWSFQTASKFIIRTDKLLQTLKQNPLLFAETNIFGVRKAIITKQTSILYKVSKTHIEILFFWDNRQDPVF